MNKLRVSPSPHVFSRFSVPRLMFDVVIALVPAFIVSVYLFGVGTLIVTASSIAFCVLFEYLIQKYILKVKPTINDGSAILTGFLLAFNVPANLPVWIIVIGALVAIGVGKMSFGGLGKNPFNPALVGRVFLLVSFPVQMTSWPIPRHFATRYIDAATGATPLGIFKEAARSGAVTDKVMDQIPSHMELFLGNMAGSAGEMAAFALLIGFVYLLVRKVISWHIPVSILLTVTLFVTVLWGFSVEGSKFIAEKTGLLLPVIESVKDGKTIPFYMMGPLFHLLTGGLILGAVYMATDYVTSPMTKKSMVIYGIAIGVITVLIRVFGAYPEGISFAILIMNAFVPLMNRYSKPKRFGKILKTA